MKSRKLEHLQDVPNIVGPATEKLLAILGIRKPADLIGKNPYLMYENLCKFTHVRHDPCVIDVFISAVRYMEGGRPRQWWKFTQERKKHLSSA
ncbi:helix-hairpin-helix domain-containing protein [Solemya velum gill symbiont]|uniref:Mitomycin resistance protein n=1 Tax=Solemya velum gill symbiont TaxID=2340 RepID=A0A1T2F8H1_SOVGS